MKVEIDKLFSDDEFENIVSEKWVKQFKKLGYLQAITKDAITKALLKHYETVEYIKGTRSQKAHFKIGVKRTSELSQADMISKGYYKANANNIKTHNIIALKMFKNYIVGCDDEVKSMTRLQWLKIAGITSNIKDLNEIDELIQFDSAFRNYYKDDTATALKSVFSFCLKQLKVDETDATVYYCDSAFDDDANADENGNKKRVMDCSEVKEMKQFVNELKIKHNVTKFMFANAEFKNELRKWYHDNLKSQNIWIEIELDIAKLKNDIAEVEISDNELADLRTEFMTEFQKYRNSTYTRREFKQKIKGKKGMVWRHESRFINRKAVITPFRQMEERNYFKFMVALDEKIGFGKADTVEYQKIEKEYNASIDDNVIQLFNQIDEVKQKSEIEKYDAMFN
ncbi:MAG: hypothetical protein GX435_08190 [Exilispira sp.]|nr:hypothetical protein [Exilispira sp.]